MSEKYYVVSESELETLIMSTADTVRASCNDEYRKLEKCEKLADQAEAACRAREVPEWATHFCKLDYYKVGDQIQEAEEIKK